MLESATEIYLDNAATTRVYPEVTDAVCSALETRYGNPSSLHNKGLDAERLLREARSWVADALGALPKEIVFTSGGTEGNNLAVKGAARAKKRRGDHVISTEAEHPSVLNALKELEEEGFRVTCLPVDRQGLVDVEAVVDALTPATVLVSVMHVNNEVGTVQPVFDIAKAVKARSKETVVHADGVQALLKLPLALSRSEVDLYTVSAHKVHGPKGVGALYVRDGVRLRPLLSGGEQEGGLRCGTENTPGIAGFGAAVRRGMTEGPAVRERMAEQRARMATQLSQIQGAFVNGPDERCAAPHILNVSFEGVRGEVLVHALEAQGVFVSTGSACSSKRVEVSHVLKALSIPKERAQGSIRISLAPTTTDAEVDQATRTIATTVQQLRATLG